LISQKRNSAKLVVWGCLPKINPQAIESVYNGPKISVEEWSFFEDLFDQPIEKIYNVHTNRLVIKNKRTDSRSLSVLSLLNILNDAFYFSDRKIWYILVEKGCNERCTYCSDRLVFSHLRSEPIPEVVSQIDIGLKCGFRHFYLVGRDLGSYGHDLNSDLPTLLEKILESHPDEDYKLSLYNMSPKSLVEFHPRLDSLFSSGKIYEIGSHIQSGSERILRLMGRKVSIRKWLIVMRTINNKYPSIRLNSSIMVGFPTETEQDFDKSLELIEHPLFDNVDVYKYEERPNLPSLRLGGRVPEEVKAARRVRMFRHVIFAVAKKKIIKLRIIALIQMLIFYAIGFCGARVKRKDAGDLQQPSSS